MKITVPADLTHNAEEGRNFLLKHTGTKFDEIIIARIVSRTRLFFMKLYMRY